MIAKWSFCVALSGALLAGSAMTDSVEAATLNAAGSYEINTFGVSGDRQRSLAGDVSGTGVVVQKFVIPNVTFLSASYTVPASTFYNGGGSDGGNTLDLYALPGSSGSAGAPAAGQIYAGLADPTSDGRVKLQSGFLAGNNFTSGTNVVNRTTDAAASAALLAFLNANAGTTIFLRLNPQAPGNGGFDGYDIYSNTGTPEGAQSGNTGPAFITYEVPEPSSALGLALAACGLVIRRRQPH